MGKAVETGLDGAVRCPFYQHVNPGRRELSCEGVYDGTQLRQKFRTGADMSGHMGSYCRAGYARCALYRLLMREKYPD